MKGGLITFTLDDDDANAMTVNRTSDTVQCPWVLYSQKGLALGQHTVKATLIQDPDEPYQPDMTPMLSVEDFSWVLSVCFLAVCAADCT